MQKRERPSRHDSRPEAIEGRFWDKVKKTESCWLWTASTVGIGHGLFTVRFGVRRVLAHRFSWELAKGPIPEGQLVLHRCDVPACVNPAHLFLGTQKENMRDMAEKGRKVVIRKLTEDQIQEIRSRYTGAWGEQARLAAEYGVTPSVINDVVKRKAKFTCK